MDLDPPPSPFSILRPPPLPPLNSHPHLHHVPLTTPGATIPTEDLSVRARGTLLSTSANGRVLTATVAGVIARVNKLVMVRPLRTKYVAETGDVVVGRVKELFGKRWKLDINGGKDAVLLLAAVNLPGGVQRRRTEKDELNMRGFFKEGDLVSAEVQELWDDGTVALHTRSMRYGKLEGGCFLEVQAELVKRAKKHFHRLECGVHLILGNNGYVFLSERKEGGEGEAGVCRERVARVRNCVVVLDMEFIAIGPDTIGEVYEMSIEKGVRLKDMTRPDVAKQICKGARSMRDKA